MTIADAQREVRTVFMGGFIGQLVSAGVWLVSASLATWGTRRAAILVLALGGACIFPVTTLILRGMGRPASLGAGNPMDQLARQVAFTVPLNFLLVAAVAVHHVNWFYPACMVVVGTHYLPFVFLYGMWQFGLLAAAMIAGAVVIGLHGPSFSAGAWVTALLLAVFACVGRSAAKEDVES
jgi:hypothetical protein